MISNQNFFKRVWAYPCIILSGLMLGACTPSWNSAYQTARSAFGSSSTLIDQAHLNPKYRYLRFEANGKELLLVLGFEDAHPDGPVEVWYGGDPVMVRLQNGRFIGSKGLQINWQDLRMDHFPDFTSVKQVQLYHRSRSESHQIETASSEQPDLAFNINETVEIKPLAAPPSIAPSSLKERYKSALANTSSIRWFSESVVSKSSKNLSPLQAFYAVDMNTSPRVVFGYQCLKTDYCISWQPWPSPWLDKKNYD